MFLKTNVLRLALLFVPCWLHAQIAQTFMLQNGFAPRKGEVFYQNGDLFFNHLTVGLTDHFSAGVGLMPTFLFEDRYINYTATLKFAAPLRSEKLNAALCLFHWGETYFDGSGGGNFVQEWGNVGTFGYGVVTFGSRRKNVSVAAGGFFNYFYPDFEAEYLTDNEPYAPYPYLGVSGYFQGSGKLALVTENHFFTDGYDDILILSGGLRFVGRAMQLDVGLGLSMFLEDEYWDAYPAPWVGLALPIGKRTRQMWRE